MGYHDQQYVLKIPQSCKWESLGNLALRGDQLQLLSLVVMFCLSTHSQRPLGHEKGCFFYLTFVMLGFLFFLKEEAFNDFFLLYELISYIQGI